MELPVVGHNFTQERIGVAALQVYAARHGQVWRETPTADVGIDGQLEFVNSANQATGKLAAVQVKAGPSYFLHRTDGGWKHYPAEKHRRYWEAFPLPVFLVLHNTESGKSYWTDARQALRTSFPDRTAESFIEVPEANELNSTPLARLFENSGVHDQPFIDDIHGVLNALINVRSDEYSFPLSYFDLFVQGLTNICRSVYYGMDLVMSAVEFNLQAEGREVGVGIGAKEQDFVFGFVKFLQAQALAHVDYADCLIDWIDREMQPHFVAPLTARGRELVRAIQREEERLIGEGTLAMEGGLRVAQEGLFEMQPVSYFRRLPRIRSFQSPLISAD